MNGRITILGPGCERVELGKVRTKEVVVVSEEIENSEGNVTGFKNGHDRRDISCIIDHSGGRPLLRLATSYTWR